MARKGKLNSHCPILSISVPHTEPPLTKEQLAHGEDTGSIDKTLKSKRELIGNEHLPM